MELGEPLPRAERGQWVGLVPLDSGHNGTLALDTAGSSFDTVLALYRGTWIVDLATVAESGGFAGELSSGLRLEVTAGTTYPWPSTGTAGSRRRATPSETCG